MCSQTAADGEACDAAGEAAVVITVSTWTPADALLAMKYMPLLSSFVRLAVCTEEAAFMGRAAPQVASEGNLRRGCLKEVGRRGRQQAAEGHSSLRPSLLFIWRIRRIGPTDASPPKINDIYPNTSAGTHKEGAAA